MPYALGEIVMVEASEYVESFCWKKEILCLHYHNVYDHQTWQSGDLLWGPSTHKAMQPFK